MRLGIRTLPQAVAVFPAHRTDHELTTPKFATQHVWEPALQSGQASLSIRVDRCESVIHCRHVPSLDYDGLMRPTLCFAAPRFVFGLRSKAVALALPLDCLAELFHPRVAYAGNVLALTHNRLVSLSTTGESLGGYVTGICASRDDGLWLFNGGRIRKWKVRSWWKTSAPVLGIRHQSVWRLKRLPAVWPWAQSIKGFTSFSPARNPSFRSCEWLSARLDS